MPGGPSSSGRFHLTIGQGMAATAVAAVLLAAAVSERGYPAGSLAMFADPKFWVTAAVRLAGAWVCVANRRLSRGMWLVLAGFLGPFLASIAVDLVFAARLANPSGLGDVMLVGRVRWVLTQSLVIVLVLGLAVTFRDVRRQLAEAVERPGDGPADPGQEPGAGE